MRKSSIYLLSLALVISLVLAGCSGNGGNATSNGGGGGSSGGGGGASADAVELEFWTFNELHQKYFESMADSWNAENPDRQIKLVGTTFPYEDMHNKLLVALQSGTGAPDISDVEISKFANYLKGEPQLVPYNDIVEPHKDKIVQSRLDIYAKDGQYYGLPYHVGASVIYYNMEILEQAGVNPEDIKTWDDFKEAGKKVVEATGIPMTTLEATEQWSIWPQLAQMDSPNDFLTTDGQINLDSPEMIRVLEYQQSLIKEGIAITTPGNFHHAEEYYGFMNNGGAASLWMPAWYMGRFTDYMPDLAGKMKIYPMPAWEEGGSRSAGMGGTGTVVTNQSAHPDLAKEFVAYAKISTEGSIQLWEQMGFDPARTDVWESDELAKENKFTEYFGQNVFDVLTEIKDEIEGVNVGELTPATIDAIKTSVAFRILVDMEDPATVLKEVADSLR